MAIDTSYATIAQYQTATGLNASPGDLQGELDSASRMIERTAGQIFNSYSATQYMDGHRERELFVPPLQTITTLKFDEDDDDAFEVTIVAGDYVLLPHDAPNQAQVEPYKSIVLRRSASRARFPRGLKTIEIVGTWGWAVVPDAIRDLCIGLTRDIRDGIEAGALSQEDLLGGTIPFGSDAWRVWRRIERDYSRRLPAMAG